MRVLLGLGPPLLLVAAVTCKSEPPPPSLPPQHFVVYSVWQRGANDHDREELNRFLDCLLARSTFADFWRGAVTVQAGGSWLVDSPGMPLRDEAVMDHWLTQAIGQNGLPVPPPGMTPLYLLFGAAEVVGESCGLALTIEHQGQNIGMPFVRATPPCWPADLGSVRSETATAEHEIVETIDALLGRPACAADGPCELGNACGANAICATFTGLYCPGAPEAVFTGCNAKPVHGWVIQKVSHVSAEGSTCPDCPTCDFEPAVIQ